MSPVTVTHHVRVWITSTEYKDYSFQAAVAIDDIDHIVFTTDDGHKHDISKKNKFEVETWDTTS